MTFSVVLLLFCPWLRVIIFHVIFWFDRRSLVEWNGKSNDVPNAHEVAWCRWGRWWILLQLAALLCPRGQSAAVRRDAALSNTSLQVLAGSWYSLLSGLTAVASLAAVHTRWERALTTFLRFTTLSVSSQPPLFPFSFSVRFWSVPFELAAVFFKRLEFVPWCLFLKMLRGI